VAEAPLIDYYAILNLPPKADLLGIENAYARLSDDLAVRGGVDETAEAALERVNEAYSVLSKPELRRVYDRAFFAREIAEAEREARSLERRRAIASGLLIGALGLVVVAQAALLTYIGFSQGTDLFTSLVP
jgi:curved DNA-binding protein CbpA